MLLLPTVEKVERITPFMYMYMYIYMHTLKNGVLKNTPRCVN